MPSQITWMSLVVFVDIIGIALVAPLLPMIAKEIGLSHTMFGVVGSLYGVAQIFSGPVMGGISDVSGRKVVFLISLVGAAVAYLGLAAATVYNSMFLMALSRITVGLVKQTMTIATAFITDETSISDRTRSLATLFSVTNIGFIVGASLGGIFSNKFGLLMPVGLSTVMYLLAFLICLTKIDDKGGSLGTKQVCPTLAAKGISFSEYSNKEAPHALPEATRKDDSRPIFTQVWEEFLGVGEDMLKNELVRKIGISSFLSTLSLVTVQTSFTMVMQRKFDLSGKENGYLISYTATVNTMVLMLLSERIERKLQSMRVGHGIAFPATAVLSGLSLILQARSKSITFMMILMIFSALGESLFKVYISSLFTKLYKAEIGAAQGILGNIEAVCRIIAPFLSGLLLDFGGISMPWTFAGCLHIILFTYTATSFSPTLDEEDIRALEKEKEKQERDRKAGKDE
eukprot:TRINITY_DN4471_c2_g1_i1.p1 TRINITY_DN4471_c2_g1~~TRINITY_DN4471_c2_g1_i1.p1  ORF type:complete len:484 (+),score=58.71 TRINITY_DN4471_c2_g1_i1:82-1452(+)